MALVGSPSDHQLLITQEVIKLKGEKKGDAREYETEYRARERRNLSEFSKTSLSQKKFW
jgi:hypothetical protein